MIEEILSAILMHRKETKQCTEKNSGERDIRNKWIKLNAYINS